MATTVLNGALGVEDVLSGKKMRDVTPGLKHLYPNIDPLFRMMNILPKGPAAGNEKIEWSRKDLLPRDHHLTTTVGGGATATLLPSQSQGGSVDTTPFKVGDVVHVPGVASTSTTSNIGVVTTVNAGTSIVVTSVGWQSNGSSTAKTFVGTSTNDRIRIIGDASEEYSQMPTAKTTQVNQEWNYIEFLRAPYIVGNIQKDAKNYTGPELTERRQETFKDIRIQAENVLFFGERYYRDGTNGRQFFSRGFEKYIREGAGDNIFDWSGGMTQAQLDDFLVKGPGKYGSDTKFLFCSHDLFLKITELGKAGERIDKTKKTNAFGLAFTRYLAPDNKTYLLRPHHLLDDDVYDGYGFVVDTTACRLRPYGTQGTITLHQNQQENDRAGVAEEYQVIFSLEVSRVEPHGLFHK